MKENTKFDFNQYLPHLLIIVGFWIISVLYVLPILQGKQLFQNDVIQAKGGAQQNVEYRKETGKISLWAENMFSGMPSYMIVMDYPMSWTTQLGRYFLWLAPQTAVYIFWYLFGFYLMMQMLGFHRWVSVLGALAYAFASYNIINIEAGHVSKCIALGFAPPFVGAVVMTYRGKILLGSSLAGIFAGVHLYGNHVQITYYLLIALFLYVFFELIKIFVEGKDIAVQLKNFAFASLMLALSGGLAIGSHASRLWTTYEYSGETIRGKSELTPKDKKTASTGTDREYAFQWSYGIGETFTFLIPNFQGGGTGSGAELGKNSYSYRALESNGLDPQFAKSLPYYWGAQPFTSGPAYLGAIVCFLFLFSLIISRDATKWWLLAVCILFTAIAWGKNFAGLNYFFFDYLPLFNKFRAHTMVLSLLQLFVAWMMLLGLQEFFSKDFNKTKALLGLKISVGVVGGFALLFALIGGAFQDYEATGIQEMVGKDGKIQKVTQDKAFEQNIAAQLQGNKEVAQNIMNAIQDDRAAMQSNDAWRSAILILLAGVILWVMLIDKLQKEYAVAALIALSLGDLWLVARRYLNDENFKKKSEMEAFFEETDADRKIKEDKTFNFRVLNTTVSPFQDATTSYHHNSVGGYHAAKLRRYQELIDAHLGKNNFAVYNMLNTKYFIGASQAGDYIAQTNPNACGNAWFVQEFKIVKNADEELKSLDGFDPKKTVFIDKRFEKQLNNLKISADKDAKIILKSAKPDELIYESNTKNAQLAIFSEIYYVNENKTLWTAYIDGKAVPHFRANYVLRGMVIPTGKHEIKFKFDSPIYHQGETISLICSVLLFAFAGFAAYMAIRAKK